MRRLIRVQTLWGGRGNVVGRKRNEGVPIVHLAQGFGLQSMLPAGTIPWQHVGKEQNSTVDVVMASPKIADQLVRCVVHEHDHGSDQRPTVIEFDLQCPRPTPRVSRLLPEKADWSQIGSEIAGRLQQRI